MHSQLRLKPSVKISVDEINFLSESHNFFRNVIESLQKQFTPLWDTEKNNLESLTAVKQKVFVNTLHINPKLCKQILKSKLDFYYQLVQYTWNFKIHIFKKAPIKVNFIKDALDLLCTFQEYAKQLQAVGPLSSNVHHLSYLLI